LDAFGNDEVTFVTLLKGNWFLGILLSHKTFLLDRCPVSGSWVVIPPWLPVDGFEVLKQCSPGKKIDVFLPISGTRVLKIFDLASWCFGTVLRNLTAYQMMRLRWGASQVPANAQNRSPFPMHLVTVK
jgi:hypothetical protein